jgi:hypothetical protein
MRLEMKLDEIVIVPEQTRHGIDKFPNSTEVLDTKFLGTYTIEHGTIGEQHVFIVRDGHTFVGALVGAEITDVPMTTKPTLMVQRTWIEPQYRRKSIMINLYRYVYNTIGYALLSDVEQTLATKNIWLQLAAIYSARLYNIQTREMEPFNATKAYDNTKQYIIFMEADHWPPRQRNVLRDHEFIMEGAN